MNLSNVERLIGSFFYVGFRLKAPGSVTSFLVFLAGWFINNTTVILVTLLVLVPFTFFLAFRFEKTLGADPQSFTLDECVGSLIVLYFVPHAIIYYSVFFIVWRLLDIIKPLFRGIEKIENGIGIVLDDILASGLTVLIYFLFTLIRSNHYQ